MTTPKQSNKKKMKELGKDNGQADAKGAYFNAASFVLSRTAFVGTHLVVLYWVNFLFNDPFGWGGVTLDAPGDQVQPVGGCERFKTAHVLHNVKFFSLWWLSHSIPARKLYKTTLGLWQHPVERPLFAFQATVMWFVQFAFWKPVSNCAGDQWSALEVSIPVALLSGTVFTLGALLMLGLIYTLPDHVFGTAKYAYPQGEFPHGGLIRGFPYGLVRHPAAAGQLWMLWALPAYTPDHLLLASLWSVFIVVGTMFEEGGLHTNDEFGQEYSQYAAETHPFFPKPSSIMSVLCPAASRARHHKAA